jgi:hypothetical protein
MRGVMAARLHVRARRLKQLVKLVYDTIREPHVTLPLPLALARLLAMPRERLYKMVRRHHRCPSLPLAHFSLVQLPVHSRQLLTRTGFLSRQPKSAFLGVLPCDMEGC